MKYIIITNTQSQVKHLEESIGRIFNNKGFWGQPQQDFNTEWVWVLDGTDLSGSSGYNSLFHTVHMNQGCPIYTLSGYGKLVLKEELIF